MRNFLAVVALRFNKTVIAFGVFSCAFILTFILSPIRYDSDDKSNTPTQNEIAAQLVASHDCWSSQPTKNLKPNAVVIALNATSKPIISKAYLTLGLHAALVENVDGVKVYGFCYLKPTSS